MSWEEVQLCFNEMLTCEEVCEIVDSLPPKLRAKLALYVDIMHAGERK